MLGSKLLSAGFCAVVILLSLDTVSTKRDAHVATRSLQTNHEKLKIDKDYDRIFFSH
jgi:hypothetical protein